MRINKFIASASDLSRRAADAAIAAGRVTVDGRTAEQGMEVTVTEQIRLDGRIVTPRTAATTILFNKPIGYVVSRKGQGSQTIYDLLPAELHHLRPVGRLDKNSSGLLLLTDDGDLAQELTHPSRQKQKIYEVDLDKPLVPLHRQMIQDTGISLADGPSRFELERLEHGAQPDISWRITMHEGRNRQIRRTFESLGYRVRRLHRLAFGPYGLDDSLKPGKYKSL